MAERSEDSYMWQAIDLARQPLFAPHPNPRVGCVIVVDGQVVAEGLHRAAGTDHAEVAALKVERDFKGGTLYVTLEPCATHGRTPPCSTRILSSGISRVVIASPDPNPVNGGLGIKQLREAGIQTEVGMLADDARALNRGFFSRYERGRPWVTVKIAATLDGRVATANGESQWISGEAARADVQLLRAQASAVLTGVGTVLADDPRLNCRMDGLQRQPLRVIVDSHLRTPKTATLFTVEGDILFATGGKVESESLPTSESQSRIVSFESADGRVDCRKLLDYLSELEVNDVLVEAGPTLVGEILDAGLVDEMVIYLAPAILGDSAKAMVITSVIKRLTDRYRGKFEDVRFVGDDIRIQLLLS